MCERRRLGSLVACDIVGLLDQDFCPRNTRITLKQIKADESDGEIRVIRAIRGRLPPCSYIERMAKGKIMNPKNFFGELKRRNVYGVRLDTQAKLEASHENGPSDKLTSTDSATASPRRGFDW